MKRIRFSIGSLLVLIAIAACVLAYVSHCRQKGRDALVQSLRSAGGELVSIDQADEKTKELLAKYNFPLTRWSAFFGTSEKPIFEVLFDADSVLSQETARRISMGNSVNAITTLRFHNANVEDSSSMFFHNWKELRHLEIRDTRFPEQWLERVAKLPKLESLIVSGGKCNLSAEDLRASKTLRSLTLSNRGIDGPRLKRLRKRLPNVDINLVAGYDSKFDWEQGKPFSIHDPEAFRQMKVSFDRIHQILDGLSPPAKNAFNRPAAEEQIALVESEIGMPLHSSVRALLEVHNGQPNWLDELVTFERFLSANHMIENYRLYQEFVHFAEKPYSFEPHFGHNSNPNLVPVGSSDDNELAVNMVDGTVWEFYSESLKPTRQADSLSEYLEMIIKRLESGHFERRKGDRVCLTGYGPADWNSDQPAQQD